MSEVDLSRDSQIVSSDLKVGSDCTLESMLSNINVTGGLKRPKSNESINKKKIKKLENTINKELKNYEVKIDSIHQEEKSESNYVQDNKINCKNISQSEKSSLESIHEVENDLIIKHNVLSELNNIDDCKNSNDSVQIPKNNCGIVVYLNNLLNIVTHFNDNDQDDDYNQNKINYEMSGNSEDNSSNLSDNKSISLRMDNYKETIINNDNEVTCDNSQPSISSSLEKLVTIDDSNDDSHLTGQKLNLENDLLQTKSNLSKSNDPKHYLKIVDRFIDEFLSLSEEFSIKINKSLITENLNQNINNVQMINIYNDNNGNEINSESTSDKSDSENKNLKNFFRLVKKMSKKFISTLENMLKDNTFTFEKFDEFCSKTVLEYMKIIHQLLQRRDFEKMNLRLLRLGLQYDIIMKQLTDFENVILKHHMDLKTNKLAEPHIIKRTVAVPSKFSFKENLSLPYQSKEPNCSPVQNDVNIKFIHDDSFPDSNTLQNTPVTEINDDDNDDDDDDDDSVM